ncbi:MAG: hypothetical protein JXP34_19290 [Planctomycetes bacterium]|nr:hypothetical protein [Planctomycetota bacterium]
MLGRGGSSSLARGRGGGQGGPGQGGGGTGRGNPAPEKATDATFTPDRAPGRISPGGVIVGQLWTRGPAPKGEAKVEYAEAVRAAAEAASDAVEREAIPREYQDAVRGYFEGLQPGEKGPR